jgi:hypothetical protein
MCEKQFLDQCFNVHSEFGRMFVWPPDEILDVFWELFGEPFVTRRFRADLRRREIFDDMAST